MTQHDDSTGGSWIDLNRRSALRGLTGATLGAIGLSGTASAKQDCNFIVDGIYIQDAIDKAEPGDTLCLENGEVQKPPEGGVLVDKPLTFVLLEEGGEPFTLDARGRGLGMRVHASDVTGKGMDIVGDSDTITGIRLDTGDNDRELATEHVTLVNNRIEGMQFDESGDHCWGIRSFGENTLSGVSIKQNEIFDIGGGSTTAGIGIGLEELEGTEPGEGAILEENEIEGMANADDPTDPQLTP